MDCYGTENSIEVCYSLENCYKKIEISCDNKIPEYAVCISKSPIEDFCHVPVPSPELQRSTVIQPHGTGRLNFKKSNVSPFPSNNCHS